MNPTFIKIQPFFRRQGGNSILNIGSLIIISTLWPKVFPCKKGGAQNEGEERENLNPEPPLCGELQHHTARATLSISFLGCIWPDDQNPLSLTGKDLAMPMDSLVWPDGQNPLSLSWLTARSTTGKDLSIPMDILALGLA